LLVGLLLQGAFVLLFFIANLLLSHPPFVTGISSAIARSFGEAFAIIMPPLGVDVSDPSLAVLVQADNRVNILIALDRVSTLVLVVLAVIAMKRKMQIN
jgi:hypothetical protein